MKNKKSKYKIGDIINDPVEFNRVANRLADILFKHSQDAEKRLNTSKNNLNISKEEISELSTEFLKRSEEYYVYESLRTSCLDLASGILSLTKINDELMDLIENNTDLDLSKIFKSKYHQDANKRLLDNHKFEKENKKILFVDKSSYDELREDDDDDDYGDDDGSGYLN